MSGATSGWCRRAAVPLVPYLAAVAITARLREMGRHPGFLDLLDMRYRVQDATGDYRVWELTPGAP